MQYASGLWLRELTHALGTVSCMPQSERDEERNARLIVEQVLKIDLEFADLNGDVDYVFSREKRRGSLEVSRITRRAHRQGAYEWQRDGQFAEAPRLRNSWLVMTEGYPRFNGIWESIGSALSRLEMHHLDRYGESMDWWLRHVPTLEEVLEVFSQRRVRAAYAYARDQTDTNDSIPKIFINPSDSWTSDGPNGAIDELNKVIDQAWTRSKFDKLDATKADEQHMWFWVDSFTLERLREPIQDPDGHVALPTVSPAVPGNVTHLWLIDDVVNHGWLWTRDGNWSWVNR